MTKIGKKAEPYPEGIAAIFQRYSLSSFGGRSYTPCLEKKHPKHYRLSLEEEIPNYNNFWYKYFWHSWPSNDYSTFHFT